MYVNFDDTNLGFGFVSQIRNTIAAQNALVRPTAETSKSVNVIESSTFTPSWGQFDVDIPQPVMTETYTQPAPEPAQPTQYDIWAEIADKAIPGLTDYGQRWHIGYFISDPAGFLKSVQGQLAQIATSAGRQKYLQDLQTFFAPLDTQFLINKVAGMSPDDLAAFETFIPALAPYHWQQRITNDLSSAVKIILSEPVQKSVKAMSPEDRANWQDTVGGWFDEYSEPGDYSTLSLDDQLLFTATVYPERLQAMAEQGEVEIDEETGEIKLASIGDFDFDGKKMLIGGLIIAGVFVAINMIPFNKKDD